MNNVEQATQQEFVNMQNRAKQIREEAREAVFTSESHRFQDRELVWMKSRRCDLHMRNSPQSILL